jgi:phosphate transport system protein
VLAEELTNLKQKLIEYALHVDKMIDTSISGLLNKDKDRLDQVARIDEPKANDKEIEIEELCTTLIAKFQPAAKDLRTIMMVAQMNNDLERMADLAVNISESAEYLIEQPSVKPLIDIPFMAQITTQMVKDSIDSFISENSELAYSVCARDASIDDLKEQINRELLTHMIANPATIDRAFELNRIANSLERIADLSTNICEDVIYIAEGKIIKHQKGENV